MELSWSTISPQYLTKDKICVTIIEVQNPALYIVKESAGMNSSPVAQKFATIETKLQEYFSHIEPTFFQLPLKDAIVVVKKKDIYYRGKVVKIISMSDGYMIRVYLVDYGYECSVPRNCMFQIPEQFLILPFQAVKLKLDDIKPITLVMNPDSLEISYGCVDEWDPSALSYVQDLKEGMVSAYVTVKKVEENFVSGSLFMCFEDNHVKCINEELVLKKYAECVDLDQKMEVTSNSEAPSETQKETLDYLDSVSSNDEIESSNSLDTASRNNSARLSQLMQIMGNCKIKETNDDGKMKDVPNSEDFSQAPIKTPNQLDYGSLNDEIESSKSLDTASSNNSARLAHLLQVMQNHKMKETETIIESEKPSDLKVLGSSILESMKNMVKNSQSIVQQHNQVNARPDISSKSEPLSPTNKVEKSDLIEPLEASRVFEISPKNKLALLIENQKAKKSSPRSLEKKSGNTILFSKEAISPSNTSSPESLKNKFHSSTGISPQSLNKSKSVQSKDTSKSELETLKANGVPEHSPKYQIALLLAKQKGAASSPSVSDSEPTHFSPLYKSPSFTTPPKCNSESQVKNSPIHPSSIELSPENQTKSVEPFKACEVSEHSMSFKTARILESMKIKKTNPSGDQMSFTSSPSHDENDKICDSSSSRVASIHSSTPVSLLQTIKPVSLFHESETSLRELNISNVPEHSPASTPKNYKIESSVSHSNPANSCSLEDDALQSSSYWKTHSADASKKHHMMNLSNSSVLSSSLEEHMPTGSREENVVGSLKSKNVSENSMMRKLAQVLAISKKSNSTPDAKTENFCSGEGKKSTYESPLPSGEHIDSSASGKSVSSANNVSNIVETTKTSGLSENSPGYKVLQILQNRKKNLSSSQETDLNARDSCILDNQLEESDTLQSGNKAVCSSAKNLLNFQKPDSPRATVNSSSSEDVKSPPSRMAKNKSNKPESKSSEENSCNPKTLVDCPTSVSNDNKSSGSEGSGPSRLNQFSRPKRRIDLESTINRKTEGVINSPVENFEEKEQETEGVINLPVENFEEDEQKHLTFETEVNDRSLWERQGVPALCLGKAVPKPMLSLSAMSFPHRLMKILESMNLEGPSSIQSVLWPAMSRGRSLVAIAPPHAGKTVGYLLPITAKLFDSTGVSHESQECTGPIAIILCSSWKKAQAVYKLLKSFLRGKDVKILVYYPDGLKINPKIFTLKNGCEILITVPSYMLEFLKEGKPNIMRCSHFILDDGNNLLSRNMKEIKTIMKLLVSEIWKKGASGLKFVLCVERWTKGASSFVDKFMETPLIFFTSFLEAAIYFKVPIHPHVVCEEAKKNHELLKILESSKRAIVCTTNSETASNIHGFLRCENVRSYLVNETQEHYISDGIIQDWNSVNSSAVPDCLIISDNALSKMSISDAKCLIHYDIPEVSRLQFGNRFSAIAEHFPKLGTDYVCESHILISEECTSQVPSLIEIVERSGLEIPAEFQELANRKIKKPADSPLCNIFKAFGNCQTLKCQFRHHIDSIEDKPAALVKEGDIHAVVRHVFDASHFVIRILKYFEGDDAIDMGISYAKIGFQLKRFYSCESNKVRVEYPVVGGHYVYQEENMYYRVKVLSVTLEEDSAYHELELLFEDEGWVKHLKGHHLYKYEESLNLGLPHAVEVFLCGVTTPDYGFEWHPNAISFMKDLIQDKEILGKVVLCLGETLWLDPVIIKEKETDLNRFKNKITLGSALVAAEHGVLSQDQLQNLLQACQDLVSLPKTIDIQPKSENTFVEKSLIQYAFLSLNEFEDVYVSSVISPQLFYVQRVKFTDCLDDLLDKINDCIKENSLKKCRNVLTGMHCIAPFSEDDRYYRALVTNATDGNEAQVFFVDFGDSERVSKDCIHVLPSDFLLLPFQAIQCELNGICPPHGGWTEQAVNALVDLTRDDAGDMIALELMAYSKSSSYEGGHHYVVDLRRGEKSVSDQLLEAGLVCRSEKASPGEDWVIEEKPSNDIPEKDATTDEESLDPEDKEMEALFCAALAKLMVQGPSKPVDSLDTIPDVTNEEEIESIETTKVEEVIDINPVTEENPSQKYARILKLMAKKKPKSAKPFITWWDTEEQVTLTIHLRDLQIYELELFDTGFLFTTSLRGVNYKAKETLYSTVHSNDTKTACKVEGLIITFQKQDVKRWPRLLKDSTKQIHIKYDMNHIDYSDTEAESQVPSPMVEGSSSIDEAEASNSTDEETSSDIEEDECRTEPWKEFSSYRDPYEPLK